ncbi:MAG: endolytic transglycosylase MltG [Ignavibacteriales bacterium]|nr:MAG: endolytic transglycosylase MltG [Ignavibacteriales bacterium]
MNQIDKKNESENLNEEEIQQLEKLRNETDKLDRKIVKLIGKRFYYSMLIGRIKKRKSLPAYSPDREKKILLNITEANEGPLDNETVARIYERLIDESRAFQQKIINHKRELKEQQPISKISWSKILGRKELIIIASVFIVLLMIFYYILFTKNSFDKQAPYRFEISIGESFTSVSERLYKEEIIPSRFNFRMAAFIYGAETKIRSGRYSIPNDLSYLDLIDLFTKGDADFIKTVKIFNGVSAKWIAGTLMREVKVDSAAFLSLVNDRSLIDSMGYKTNSLDGYLMPGRYLLFENSSADEILDTLLLNMNLFFNDSVNQQIQKQGRTKHEIITLASIVEGETNKIEEMPLIAGVYSNRLRIGMKLQADPTVQYLQPNGWKRLLYKDLRINSPYNTYMYGGLPPGPINNPGKEALLAAVYPAEHNYLYFVADGTGGHKFAKSFSEHLKNVNAYRTWLKNQK